MSETIDPKLASQLLDLIPKAYYGNTNHYGNGMMGYHVGWLGTVCVHVRSENVPSWKDLTFRELVSMLEELIAASGLPVMISPEPEFMGAEWQVYFTTTE